MLTLINGRESASVDVTDRGLQYGDGLFETIAVGDGPDQFVGSAPGASRRRLPRLAIVMPDRQLLRDEVQRVAGNAARAVVKIIVTRGSGGRGYRPDGCTLSDARRAGTAVAEAAGGGGSRRSPGALVHATAGAPATARRPQASQPPGTGAGACRMAGRIRRGSDVRPRGTGDRGHDV